MDSTWCKVGVKLPYTDEFQGLRRMVEAYDWDARELYGRYRELETARARSKCTAQEYANAKSSLDSYKAPLLRVREAVRALTTASAKKQRNRLSRTAREGYCFAVVCKGCGELKRRKYRSDALQWQRQHLAQHARHEVEIVERLSEEAARASCTRDA
jgi:hypothetical protein